MNKNYPIPLPTLSHEVVGSKLRVKVSGKIVVELPSGARATANLILSAIQAELEEEAKKEATRRYLARTK